MVSLASSSSIRPFWLYCEEVFGPVDPRYVIYTNTRLRKLSTDQSSRRTPPRKKCTSSTNASSAAIQAQVAPSLGASVFSRTLRRWLAEG
ncbi:UNVERIFIED_CONTAM: hypothetical protein NCL1_15433 [Trichonephila clavipes]